MNDTQYIAGFQVLSVIYFQIRSGVIVTVEVTATERDTRALWLSVRNDHSVG